MSDLFQSEGDEENDRRPLADRLRPAALSEIVGQDHLIGSEGPVGRMVAAGHLSAIIFWGPPGTGKTQPLDCWQMLWALRLSRCPPCFLVLPI